MILVETNPTGRVSMEIFLHTQTSFYVGCGLLLIGGSLIGSAKACLGWVLSAVGIFLTGSGLVATPNTRSMTMLPVVFWLSPFLLRGASWWCTSLPEQKTPGKLAEHLFLGFGIIFLITLFAWAVIWDTEMAKLVTPLHIVTFMLGCLLALLIGSVLLSIINRQRGGHKIS